MNISIMCEIFHEIEIYNSAREPVDCFTKHKTRKMVSKCCCLSEFKLYGLFYCYAVFFDKIFSLNSLESILIV